MKILNISAGLFLALALGACVEGQGPARSLLTTGHLGDQVRTAAAQPPASGAATSVVGEARDRQRGGGAKLLGQSRSAAPRTTSLSSAPAPNGPPVSLNLQGAAVADAAALILGDALSLPYVVDPDLAGTVSLRTDNLPPAQLLESFRAALQGRGLALSETGGLYRVSTASNARPGGATLFTLRNIPASEAAKALELALPAEQVRAVTTGSEALLVTGTPDEIDLARVR